ncbi:MAG: hypothetical protein ACKV2O_00240 [Acidimicrobiales bacterium]
MTDPTGAAFPHPPALQQTREDLLALRAELLRQRQAAPTPGVAHALRLADAYLFLALGYCGHNDELFPEEGLVDEPDPFTIRTPLPNLH